MSSYDNASWPAASYLRLPDLEMEYGKQVKVT